MSRLLEIISKEIEREFTRTAGPGIRHLGHEVLRPGADTETLLIRFAVSSLDKEHAVGCYLTAPLDMVAAECGRGARDWVELQAERAA